jgi:hypothetical protein
VLTAKPGELQKGVPVLLVQVIANLLAQKQAQNEIKFNNFP